MNTYIFQNKQNRVPPYGTDHAATARGVRSRVYSSHISIAAIDSQQIIRNVAARGAGGPLDVWRVVL